LFEAQLNAKPHFEEHSAQFEKNPSSIIEGRHLIEEIFDETFCLEKDIYIGNYLDQEDIPTLVEMIFNSLLGTWVNQIICVGQYSDTLPLGYQSESETLYDYNYTEVPSLRDFAEQFFESLESHSANEAKATVFRVEYS
jgi:hypothetical protein